MNGAESTCILEKVHTARTVEKSNKLLVTAQEAQFKENPKQNHNNKLILLCGRGITELLK